MLATNLPRWISDLCCEISFARVHATAGFRRLPLSWGILAPRDICIDAFLAVGKPLRTVISWNRGGSNLQRQGCFLVCHDDHRWAPFSWCRSSRGPNSEIPLVWDMMGLTLRARNRAATNPQGLLNWDVICHCGWRKMLSTRHENQSTKSV